mmetsp:Transcript_108240/g.305063  ORF Transcript_108240/g.305063 Transcript_108240/m.305063 type:complete len:351 (-) Transcript_108240:721-1773(-)
MAYHGLRRGASASGDVALAFSQTGCTALDLVDGQQPTQQKPRIGMGRETDLVIWHVWRAVEIHIAASRGAREPPKRIDCVDGLLAKVTLEGKNIHSRTAPEHIFARSALLVGADDIAEKLVPRPSNFREATRPAVHHFCVDKGQRRRVQKLQLDAAFGKALDLTNDDIADRLAVEVQDAKTNLLPASVQNVADVANQLHTHRYNEPGAKDVVFRARGAAGATRGRRKLRLRRGQQVHGRARRAAGVRRLMHNGQVPVEALLALRAARGCPWRYSVQVRLLLDLAGMFPSVPVEAHLARRTARSCSWRWPMHVRPLLDGRMQEMVHRTRRELLARGLGVEGGENHDRDHDD